MPRCLSTLDSPLKQLATATRRRLAVIASRLIAFNKYNQLFQMNEACRAFAGFPSAGLHAAFFSFESSRGQVRT